MKTPQLYVWNGNSETDELDLLRYVKATDKDILSQEVVVNLFKNKDIREYKALTCLDECLAIIDALISWADNCIPKEVKTEIGQRIIKMTKDKIKEMRNQL